MIFDDLQLEKQNKCEIYYITGRYNNIDYFYLAQKTTLNFPVKPSERMPILCLFPQDQKNVHHSYNDHVSTDISKEDFKKLCETAWSQPHGIVVIDLTSYKDDNKYMLGPDNFYIPDYTKTLY